jgi:hypothetical protein
MAGCSSSPPNTSLASFALPRVSDARAAAHRMCVLVRLVDVVDGDDGQITVVAEVAKRNASASLDANAVYRLLRHVERDGNTEERTVGEANIVYNAGTVSTKQIPVHRQVTHPS